jgi:hypothetical protein
MEIQRASPLPFPPLASTYTHNTYSYTPAAAAAAPTPVATEWGHGWESSWFVGETPEQRAREEALFGEFCTLFGTPSPVPSFGSGGRGSGGGSGSQDWGLGWYEGGGNGGGLGEGAFYAGGGFGAPFPGQYMDG